MTTTQKNKINNPKPPGPPNLKEVIEELFLIQGARSIQDDLWLIIKAALSSSDADEWSPIERANFLFLYEQLHNLIADLDQTNTIHKYRDLVAIRNEAIGNRG